MPTHCPVWTATAACLLLLAGDAFAQPTASDSASQQAALKSAFAVPAEWQGKYGSYSPLLMMADGSSVTNVEQWQQRRTEILRQWHELMGAWPAIITEPEVEVLEQEEREGFQQLKISFQWTPHETTTGYLLLPPGDGPHPAVVTVYYEPETSIGLGLPHRDFGLQLVRRGFVVLSLGTTEATAAKTYSIYYPSLEAAEVEPLSMLAYAAANAWHVLAARPEVDAERIGIVGHSFGGKWAMFAACLYDKYRCGVWSDPGIMFDDLRSNINYWEPWYLGYHPPPWRKRGLVTKENPAYGTYPALRTAEHDLHELQSLMAPRPFLVSGGEEDPPSRWEALNHIRDVYDLYGVDNGVGMTNRPEHAPNADSNAVIYGFFEQVLGEN